jgi:hypothetical protein
MKPRRNDLPVEGAKSMTRRSSFPPDPVRKAVVEEVTSHPVFEDLVQQTVTSAPEASITTTAARTQVPSRRHLRRRRSWLAAVVVVIAVLGAVLPIVLTGGGGLSHAITTPFEAAKPFTPSRSSSAPPLRSGKWQLTGALLSGKWSQNTEGPPAGWLTCASTSACYDLSGYYTSANAGQTPRYYSLYVTTDLGRSWSVLAMPAGFQASTALSCPATSTCAAGGTLNGQPVLVVSTDAGSQWTITPLTGLPDVLVELACSSATACHGIVGPPWTAADAAPYRRGLEGPSPHEVFVTTTNAGRTWESSPLPAADLVYGLACPYAGHCVVIGSLFSSQAAFVRSTADGGASWETGSLPAGFTVDSSSGVSCADAEHCLVLGNIPLGDTNPPQCAKMPGLKAQQAAFRRAAARRAAARGEKLPKATATPPMSPVVKAISKAETALALQAADSQAIQGSFSCSYPPGSGGLLSDIAASTDGGLTWTPEPLPANVPDPQLDGVSCASATECWVAGSELVAKNVGGGSNASSSVLLGTTDGGAAWSKVVFTVPTGAPDAYGQSYLSIGDVDCPAQGACIALGVVAQSSPTAPVYSFVSAPAP